MSEIKIKKHEPFVAPEGYEDKVPGIGKVAVNDTVRCFMEPGERFKLLELLPAKEGEDNRAKLQRKSGGYAIYPLYCLEKQPDVAFPELKDKQPDNIKSPVDEALE